MEATIEANYLTVKIKGEKSFSQLHFIVDLFEMHLKFQVHYESI